MRAMLAVQKNWNQLTHPVDRKVNSQRLAKQRVVAPCEVGGHLVERRPLYALHVGLDRESPLTPAPNCRLDEKFELAGDSPGRQMPAASRSQTPAASGSRKI